MPELVVGQAGKELTHNQALAVLDQLAQAVVVDKDLTAPPGSPANGSMYIVAAGATGAWSGQSGKLAYWLTTVAAWTFIAPADGWSVWVADEAVRYELLAGVWTIVSAGGGGGGSGDMLSTLLSTEVSVAGAVTLGGTAFGKMHVCSGTSADYTVGLPAVSGNAGKLIGFRMSSALTKIVTLDGNASEQIDGVTTRAMWAKETAILLCDGTTWTKISGKSIPMVFKIVLSAGQSLPALTLTKVALDTVQLDTGSTLNVSTNRMTVRRPASWEIFGGSNFATGNAGAVAIAQLNKNGALLQQFAFGHMAGTYNLTITGSAIAPTLVAADYLDLNVYCTIANTIGSYTSASGTFMSGTEIIEW